MPTLPTISYVDEDIGTDTGDGSVGDPYGLFSRWIANAVYDSADGTIVAIKEGNTIVGSDWALPFGGTLLANLTFLNWDGTNAIDLDADEASNGRGSALVTFDGNNTNVPIFDAWGGASHTMNYVNFSGFEFTNVGASEPLIQTYNHYRFSQCLFRNNGGGGIAGVSTIHGISDCMFLDCGGTNFLSVEYGALSNNYFLETEPSIPGRLLCTVTAHGSITNNIFDANGSQALQTTTAGNGFLIANNTFLQKTKGTVRDGIWFSTSKSEDGVMIQNNIFSGFEEALAGWLGTYSMQQLFGNTFHDNNDVLVAIDNILYGSRPAVGRDNEIITDDPLSREGSKPTGWSDFQNRFTYYKPNDVGQIYTGGYPVGSGMFRGAVRPAAAAGGGGGELSHPLGLSRS